ncbi:MAG: hypothetical protein NTV22_13060 [bacterium]|nr:hypothetical protein [bacterium]
MDEVQHGNGFRAEADKFATKARRHEEATATESTFLVVKAKHDVAVPYTMIGAAISSCLRVFVTIISELRQDSGFIAKE